MSLSPPRDACPRREHPDVQRDTASCVFAPSILTGLIPVVDVASCVFAPSICQDRGFGHWPFGSHAVGMGGV